MFKRKKDSGVLVRLLNAYVVDIYIDQGPAWTGDSSNERRCVIDTEVAKYYGVNRRLGLLPPSCDAWQGLFTLCYTQTPVVGVSSRRFSAAKKTIGQN